MLADELNCVTKTSEYDDFGMYKGSNIHIGGESLLKREVEYKSQNKTQNGTAYKQLSHIVSKDVITAGGAHLTDRSYTTDALGRVTGITDSVFGNHTYAYDSRGFLTSADGETYEYDANGNITKLGDTVLTYGGVMKDRLTSVNGKEITYANDSSINPTSWDGKAFKFEGRRLISIINRALTLSFKYDDQGRRIEKTSIRRQTGGRTQTSTTKFYYDGDKLITEISSTHRLDFLYDENGSLYGFVYNNTDKYFYVRDSLENILGIIDSDGNIVVQYKYSAWGALLETTGTLADTVGGYNPFRYKGYYYDGTYNMYYCQSRFYLPSWGRWLNADSPSFLDEEALETFNLFAYCSNDPINCIDESGCLPRWAKWLIGGIAFLGAVALTCLTGGAVAPVLIGMAGSILSNGIMSGLVSIANNGNFWEGFRDGAADGALWGGVLALGGATLRTVKMFKNGVAIGENMKRVSSLAKVGNQITYKGMPGYNLISKIGGDNLARRLSMQHNKAFIERMMRWGVEIVDFGIDASRSYRSFYYLMETIVSNGYAFLQIMY